MRDCQQILVGKPIRMKVRRLHQEDFCQALGVPRRLKYEKDGGPGLRQYLELLRRNSTDYLADEPELIRRIAFNYLIGNADAHAKNFGCLPTGVRQTFNARSASQLTSRDRRGLMGFRLSPSRPFVPALSSRAHASYTNSCCG